MNIYVGAASPEYVTLVVTDSIFAFTDVTSDELVVTAPSGAVAGWAWTRDTSVPGRITLTHEFAVGATDVTEEGVYRITGWLVTATTRRRIRPVSLPVVPYR